DICWEWEERTGMRLEFDEFQKVFQKDVNNYLIVPAGPLHDEKDHNDEFEIEFPDTLRIERYTEVLNWYKNPLNRDYSKSLEIDV
ncbi:hypothetical protein, partial [Faecalibacterium duncaniae]|uniref:hypothetical protein n=1 Tax=Faecalibacterium duncaniae (strain DSM 17677 / JCM 31915 / A2-165) TaxID=411483 RepID=UPI0029404AFE